EEWNRKFSPYIRRDWSKIEICECWIGDQKQLDNPCVFRGKLIYPWCTIFEDMKSRAYVGWILTAIPDAWAVSQALVYGVRKFGPPATVYLDRGKQYRAKVIAGGRVKIDKVVRLFEDINETIIPGIFGELGIEIFWAAPYNPREKPVEPSFRVFNRLRHIFPGYRGPYVTKRPKDHAKLLKSAKIPSLEEMARGVDTIVGEYNERVHSETNRSPNSFFSNFKPMIPSEKLLAFLLLTENHVKVKDSTVTVDGLVYRHDELWRLAGELVEVRRDPQNIQRAAIIYQNKVFCFATLEVADHYRSPKTLESVKTTRRIRRKVSKWRKSALEHEGAIEDPLTYAADLEEMEIMRSRDIQPAEAKVTRLHNREKLAREAVAGINKEDEEIEETEKKAAVGRKLTLEDLIPPPDPEPEKRPKLDLFHKGLTIFNEPNMAYDEDDFYED
ncbi:MAG: transposase, partial [Candidatus Marinimicrobia bacterium]|nr:transposase [Candidatus Neomarinimicrobiota bacterium]